MLARSGSSGLFRWLRTFARRVLVWFTSDDNIFVGRMAVAEGHAFPDVGATYRRLAVEPIQLVLAERLRAWNKANILEYSEPHTAAVCFLDLAISGLVSRRLYGVQGELSEAEATSHIDNAVNLFLLGTLPRV